MMSGTLGVSAGLMCGGWPVHMMRKCWCTAPCGCLSSLFKAAPFCPPFYATASPGCSAAGMLLLAAATLGHACAAQLLLLLQPSAAGAKGGAEGVSPLHQAAEGGHTAIMQAVLAAMPGAVYLKSHAACSPLLHAASKAQSAAVRLLLDKAPAVATDASRTRGGLPLHMAALATTVGAEEEAVVETLTLLLEAAPETATAVDFEGETALYWATASRSEAAVRLLLAKAPAAAMVASHTGVLPVRLPGYSASRPANPPNACCLPAQTCRLQGRCSVEQHPKHYRRAFLSSRVHLRQGT